MKTLTLFSLFYLLAELLLANKYDCIIATKKYEEIYDIPKNLLLSMSLTESGRRIKNGEFISWPWTINKKGKGKFFDNKETAINYVKEYTNACKNSTMLGIWSHGMYFQATHFYELIFKLCPDTPKICAQALEPYYFMKNENYRFNKIFKNQRVLVITSHVETTKQQIALALDNIYDKPIFDTTTKFHLYKPPQQNAGNSDNQCYKVHLQKMKEDLDNIAKDFDFTIALVSCGGFGMLISDYIYKMNRNVIYVGGALQLYFGIMGNRWRTNANITPLYNSYWTDVLNEDKPESLTKNSFLCENSCYW